MDKNNCHFRDDVHVFVVNTVLVGAAGYNREARTPVDLDDVHLIVFRVDDALDHTVDGAFSLVKR